jgi:DNA-binding transcriptional regulator YbjK
MPPTSAPEHQAALGSKAARTRSAIIDAALRLFRQHGYEATTMRAIASEAGVSVGNAYYYFASKQHLIRPSTTEPNSNTPKPAKPSSNKKPTSPPGSSA